MVYGDSDLIKRAIRDIYNREIDEVIVEGEEGYRQAKEFMKLLMPSHARRVQHYSDAVPLFQRSHVEDQLAAMYHPVVQLKSGGYLVINPTEALVSIDINSGRSTREHNIEQTATATNLEAAQEIARQLRLRDMAGLVVIDFIDMDNGSNVRKVEKAMKEALKNDRARIQVGRISSFGLMEMSRQRLRTGVLEASTRACPHCEGTGLVRTASSAGLSALRLIEDEAARGRGSLLTLRASQEAAVYVLNRKRADIAEIEDRYGVSVEILPDRDEEGARMSVEASGPPPAHAPRFDPVIEEIEDDIPEEIELEDDEIDEEEAADETPRRAERPERADDSEGEGGRRRRRRRGRRGRNRPEGEEQAAGPNEANDAGGEVLDVDDSDDADGEDRETFAGEQPVEGEQKRRRRSRRGRRNRRRDESPVEAGDEAQADETDDNDRPAPAMIEAEPAFAAPPEAEATPAPRARRRPRARGGDTTDAPPVIIDAGDAAPVSTGVIDEPVAVEAEPAAEAPKPRRSRRKTPVATEAEPLAEAAPDAELPAVEEAAKPRRRSRRKADAPATEDAAEATTAAVDPEATLLTGQDGTIPPEPAAAIRGRAGSRQRPGRGQRRRRRRCRRRCRHRNPASWLVAAYVRSLT